MKNSMLIVVLSMLASLAQASVEQTTVMGKVVGIEPNYIRVAVKKGSVMLAPRPQIVSIGEQVTVTFDGNEFKKKLKRF